MKIPASVILLLALTAGAVLAQMKSANLDPDAWYSIIAVHKTPFPQITIQFPISSILIRSAKVL